MQEVVLATHQDAFFAETQYANFGEMAEHINAALSEFRVSDIAALIESALAMPLGLRCAIDVMGFAHASLRGRASVQSAACRTHTTVRRTAAALSSQSVSRT